MDSDDYFTCSHCGAELASSASFCRVCGASDESGWNAGEENSAEDDFDYDEYLAREFPGHGSPSTRSRLRRTFVVLVLLTLAAVILLSALFH